MPFEKAIDIPDTFVPSNNLTVTDLFREDAAKEQQQTGFFESLSASYGLYNPVTTSFLAITDGALVDVFSEYDSDFVPEDHMQGWEEYSDILASAKDQHHMDRMKTSILRTKRYEDAISNAGGTGIATSLAAGVLDPIGLVTFAPAKAAITAPKIISKVRTLEKVGKVTTTAAKGAAAGAVSIAASEAVLQATNPYLTAEETIKAIGAGSLLGGIVGGGARIFTLSEYKGLSSRMKSDFEHIAINPAREVEYNTNMTRSVNSTAGAMQNIKYKPDDFDLVGTFGFAKLTKFLNPTLRVMQSQSAKAKEVYMMLADTNLKTIGAMRGTAMPRSVESYAKLYDTNLKKAVQAELNSYKQHKVSRAEMGEKPLSRMAFKKRISQALRRGDVDIENDDVITQAAQQIRSSFIEPLKKEAINVGLFDADIEAKFADSYLSRMWNPAAIRADVKNFQSKMTDWALDKISREVERVENTFLQKQERINKRIEKDQSIIDTAPEKIKNIESRFSTKVDYQGLATVKDDYLEFLKEEIGLQEVAAYIARNDLGNIANMVNMAIARIPNKPTSLVAEIIKRGGIKPDQNLRAKGITNKTRVGLFRENGLGLDVMLRDMADEGYFPEYRNMGELDEFMIDDLRAAIEDDIFGAGVYREQDIDLVMDIDELEALATEADETLTRIGISDYKSFYKNIREDIKLSKRDLKSAAKEERARIKAAREAAREVIKFTKPLRDELKAFRNAESARIRREASKAETRIKKQKERLDNYEIAKNQEIVRFKNANDDGYTEYAKEVVDEITQTLARVDRNPNLPEHIRPIASGPLKSKTLDVDDIDFEDYLENDIRVVMDYYRHHMGTQIEMQRAFGSNTLEPQIQQIKDDYMRLVDEAPSEKQRKKLLDEQSKVIRDIEAVRDIMQHRYGNPSDPDSIWVQAGMTLRDLNFMKAMGGVTISSLADVFRPVMINGLENTLDAAMLKGFSGSLKKMTIEELDELGVNLEAVLAHRLQSLAEIGDPLNRGTAVTRFTGNAANVFSKVTLINYWNDVMKSVTALSTQNRLMKAINNGSDKSYLSELGISDDMARTIKEQIARHGEDKLSGVSRWDNEAAQRLWKAAVRSEVDKTIVTRSAGDLPLIAQTPAGKLFFQFKTFMMASHNKVLLRGLQSRGDEVNGAVLGATAMIAMGMMIAAIKAEMYNRSAGLRGSDNNFDTSTWNKRKWLLEGIDRSGLISVILEPLHIADKAAGLGPSLLTGQGQNSRYASRNIVGALGGPTVGTLGDIAIGTRALAAPLTGADISKSDIYAMRRIMPFQNAFIFRQVFDILEREVGQAVGAQ